MQQNHIHETIVVQQAFLCNGLSDFVQHDGNALLIPLAEFNRSSSANHLEALMTREVRNARLDVQLRRLLGKLEMQLQVVRDPSRNQA